MKKLQSFEEMILEKQDIHMQKNELGSYFIPYTINQLKMDQTRRVKSRSWSR